MSYSKSNWCSPSNIQGSCLPEFSGGEEVCKPMNRAALTKFKALQVALNSALARDKRKLLKVDGRLGIITLGAINSYVSSPFKDCNELAHVISETTQGLAKIGASLPGEANSFKVVDKGGLSKLFLFAILGVVGYLYYKETKENKNV